MANYDPPYKTVFFVCYLTVAAIVASEAGSLGNSESYAANQPYDAFGDEWYLVNEEEHPWCGTLLRANEKIGTLVPRDSEQ
jgi:hypothetical protein